MFDPFQRNETEMDAVIEAFEAHKDDDDRGVAAADMARRHWRRRAEWSLEEASKSMREMVRLLWEANGGCLYGTYRSFDIDGLNPNRTFGHMVLKFAYATPEESWRELWKYLDHVTDGETAWSGLCSRPEDGEVFDIAIDEWTAV